jgi:hypothetical protein
VAELFETLAVLFRTLGRLGIELVQLGLAWSLLLVWIAWWLWAVNWKKAWKVLAEGGWMPLVLISVMASVVWSHVSPTDWHILPTLFVPNFWWHLGAVCLLVGSALFCGWVQGYFGWTPAEIDLEPPAPAADASHGHAHH